MHRQPLLDTLRCVLDGLDTKSWPHASFDRAEEAAILAKFLAFVSSTPDCFERTSPHGHITGSALVVSPDLRRVLLTHHAKLDKWLQLGGHSDGSPKTAEVAYREVEEESGLTRLSFVQTDPYDFDWHDIPARPNEPAHIHYDVRFLIAADPEEPLVITKESKDLRWFTVDEARRLTSERSMHRQFDKLEWLRQRLS
jgi:8-oxo-dGTP pyrophosphatase MutT (NUDIX family)